MTKAALIDRIAVETALSRRDAARALEGTLSLIVRELQAGGDVALTGFGRFHTAQRGARAGVNPRTGEPITVRETIVPRFSAGAALKKAVRRP